MAEGAFAALSDQGLLGILLALALLAVVALFWQLQKLNAEMREMTKGVTEALVGSASSQDATARALEQNTAMIQAHLMRGGGGK